MLEQNARVASFLGSTHRHMHINKYKQKSNEMSISFRVEFRFVRSDVLANFSEKVLSFVEIYFSPVLYLQSSSICTSNL